MIKVYLKAKTFDDLIVKMQMMNTLSGKQYQFNESYFAKNEFHVTFQTRDLATWKRVSDLIEERFSKKQPKKKEVK